MRASISRDLAEADAGPSSDYLIVEKGAKGESSKFHLRVRKNGTPDRGLAGGAHAALFSASGYRGNRYDGPDKETAKKKLRSFYKEQGWGWPGETKESAPPPDPTVVEPIGFPDALTIITETQGVYATITGKWLKEGVLSKNNNYYSPETVRQSVAMTQARIERNDPPVLIMETHDDSESDRATTVVGKIDRVWMAGDLACYGGSIANTSRGRDIATLILGGFGSPGVSLRAAAKKERALHEGAQVWNVHPFPALGIDFTRRPGLGEYGSVDNITLLESVSEKDVTPDTADDDKKKDDEKDDKDEDTDHTDDEDEDDKAKAKKDTTESAGPASQAEFDAALLEAHRNGDDRATLSTLVETADERGLLVPRGVRASLAAEEGADRAADFFYAVATTLKEAKALPLRGLEEYCRDHFSLIERQYADGAGFTARDKAAFPKADYAGTYHTLPIRTQHHVREALALLPYIGDQDGFTRNLAAIAARKGLTLPSKEITGMTTEELEGLIDRRVEERVAGALNRTPNMRGRDHLRSAHDHVAACLGYACHGGGHAKLGEASEFGNVDFGRMAEAHDNLATTLQLTCAPMNAAAHAPTVAADHNPLQDRQAAPKQAADAFAGKPARAQSVDMGGSLGEASPRAEADPPRRDDGAVQALVEAVRALTQVTTQNQAELVALKAGIEESEKQNWRDRPTRQTTHNQNEPESQSVEALVEMANNKSLDPMTRLHNASAWLQEALGVTEQ